MGTQLFSVRLPKAEHETIKAIAVKKDLSVNQIIRMLLRGYIEENKACLESLESV